jgi:NAD(P)-dependent dehydrogenase (short-subunit alcohol dehydrogenase family)
MDTEKTLPPQTQDRQPGLQALMDPAPESTPLARPGGRLSEKRAVITGGDSGIGRAVAVAFAREGADVAIAYLDEDEDAEETSRLVGLEGRRCWTYRGDIGAEQWCKDLSARIQADLGRVDVLVNNAGEQHPQDDLADVTRAQMERTFATNVFGMISLTRELLPLMANGSSIINTTSVTAFRGSAGLLDYSATKGAIVAFTRSLALNVVDRGIRVNAVAPGPIWTPLIPSTFPAEEVATFGADVPMARPGQPREVAPSYVYLASADSEYVSGQVIHVNGGQPVA